MVEYINYLQSKSEKLEKEIDELEDKYANMITNNNNEDENIFEKEIIQKFLKKQINEMNEFLLDFRRKNLINKKTTFIHTNNDSINYNNFNVNIEKISDSNNNFLFEDNNLNYNNNNSYNKYYFNDNYNITNNNYTINNFTTNNNNKNNLILPKPYGKGVIKTNILHLV